jgi:hypothetical protein
MNYSKLRERPDHFLLLTGLKVKEFDNLLLSFESNWDYFINHFKLNGEPRKNRSYVHQNNPIPLTSEKLFFILYYLRHNPTQAAMAATFDMEKYQANQWIQRLLKILKQSLDNLKMLPERNPKKLEEILRKAEIENIWLDATERPIPRSTDNETQKENFSGKKKDI